MSISTPSRETNGAGAPQSLAGLPEGVGQQPRDRARTPGHLLIDG